ncbi:MAG: hypothetical protein NUW08_03190 [Candidatus Uhrbacteria bacterium]|nr:hypothetical protein [Candidatus Uhrbacteria bacterium]
MADNHVIGSGLTEQEMKLSSFWIRNRPLMSRIGYGSLIAFAGVCWLFVLWSLLDAYAISYPREARVPRVILQNQLALEGLRATAPRPIEPSQATVFDTTEGRQDILVEILNQNATWWAEFDYQFDLSGERTPMRKGYVLPNGRRYITELGYEPTTRGRTARLVVENVRWMRVDPAVVGGSYEAFADARLQFRVEDVAYARDLTIGTQTVGQSTFTLVNDGAFGYWNPSMTVVLSRGTTPVGVTTIQRAHIRPGETVPMTINWFDNIAGVSRTDVQVNVNILDPAVYVPTSGI